MEVLLILLSILAAVASRTIPGTTDTEPVYVPTKEQLEMIFGNVSSQGKPPSSIKMPIKVEKDSISSINSTPDKYVPATVEVNISINVDSDSDKGVSINETVKENNNAGKSSTGNEKVEIKTRFVDRVAFGGSCSSELVRVGNTCVAPD